MNTKRLEKLNELNEKLNQVLNEIETETEKMKIEYQEKEETVLQNFIKSMRELISYGKQGMKGAVGTLGFYGKPGPDLIYKIIKNGEFILETNPAGYGQRPIVYDSRYDQWNWYEEQSKRYISGNKESILGAVQVSIEKQLHELMKLEMDSAIKKQAGIANALADLENN